MNYIAALLFIVLLALWPHQTSTEILPSSPHSITKVCEKTLFKDLCKATLQSFPDRDKADLHDLAKTALKYASLNASSILGIIREWQKISTDATSTECLHDCYENYGDAVEQLEDSLAALDSKRYSDVQTWVSAAMSALETCQVSCDGNFPVVAMTKVFSKLCNNALAIIVHALAD